MFLPDGAEQARMVGTQDDYHRWVLIDPLGGHGFPRPLDGRHLGIEEIRALPIEARYWLADAYRTGDWSLFMPYRRTNWSRLGPLEDVLGVVFGESRMDEVSLRASMIEAEHRLLEIALAAMALLAVAGVLGKGGRMRNAAA